ncbi:SAM-dependent methyltransferase [Motiliproteus sediminis]|uniref:SAM-dependent methyltransferase n=1 Tax=Motiliproteus sediminis TaxID=1468178 RepID=UPI001AEFF993|nr:cyclopropane-fatty-acyl-phospholipid synthase family protein [Motiliproteus sediminis]
MTTSNRQYSVSRRRRQPSPSLTLRWLQQRLDEVGISSIRLLDPDGSAVHAGEKRQDIVVPTLSVRRLNALWRAWRGGLIGWAEGYMAGDWDTPDLADLCHWAAANEQALERAYGGSRLQQLFNRLLHRLNANSRRGSRRNIAFHYDLGNDFYRQWLDPSMTYSSALFEHPGQTLEQAQYAKNRKIMALLQPQQGDQVLEIGCGWGGFGEQLLRQHPVDWHGVTLSREQLHWTQQRLHCFGRQANASLTDYRDIRGQYQRIVSIEMLEAVGEEHWPHYFNQLHRLLSEDGSAVIQVITIDEQRFDSYRRGADFIQRYIFPGGVLPTSAAVHQHAARAGLVVDQQFAFGQDYALTLRHWREAFNRRWPEIAALGFDQRFRRLWNFYLCYCEAGFASGAIDVQLFRFRPHA